VKECWSTVMGVQYFIIHLVCARSYCVFVCVCIITRRLYGRGCKLSASSGAQQQLLLSRRVGALLLQLLAAVYLPRI